MKRLALCLVLLGAAPLLAAADGEPSRNRPVATYSIVARDPATGQLGVAVQSHWFSVGSLVTWARADEGRDVRQVAMIDAQGRVAAHTGAKAIVAAGHQVGRNYAVQANLMLSDQVWPRMAAAYESASGTLAERMMAALEAAQDAGGDIRGRQSAAMLIVSGERQAEPWQGVILELRVEDHPEPLQELRRLLRVHRAYEHMNAGDLAVEHGDNEAALKEYGLAMEMFPGNLEMKYWTAVALVNMGRAGDSYELFQEIFRQDKNWRTLLGRLPASGLMQKKDVQAVLRKVR